MLGIVGRKNAGFTIIKEEYNSQDSGYCIGQKEREYVTWYFRISPDETGVDYHMGHYFSINPDSPYKSKCAAMADFYHRLADTYDTQAKYDV